MKYRKKPVVVEAEQWFGPRKDGPTPTPRGVHYDSGANAFYVLTIHNTVTHIRPGDWIVSELDGIHHHPCSPAVFAANYEKAE